MSAQPAGRPARGGVFVEFLTVRAWCCSILPYLVAMRLRQKSVGRCCYVIDGTRAGYAIARATRWMSGLTVEPLQFRLLDVRDDRGLLLRLRIAYQDLGEVLQEIAAHPAFRRALAGELGTERFPAYIAKALSAISFTDRQTLWRALVTIQVCAWHKRQAKIPGSAVYFLERRVWWNAIARYAMRVGITAIPLSRAIDPRAWARRLITPELKRLLYHLQAEGILGTRRIPSRHHVRLKAALDGSRRAQLAVEYYGSLNLDHPARHSDLFFWRFSTIVARDVIVTFNIEAHPLDARKLDELHRHGMNAVAMRPRVRIAPEARVFLPRLRGQRGDWPKTAELPGGLEGRWFREQMRKYYREERAFWAEFFEAARVKIYVSWFRYTQTHCAIADALKRVGGISAIYQRAHESFPSAETAVATDVFFAYSPAMADIERRSGSQIPYLVATGYLGDYRFPLAREEAQRVRGAMQRQGAQRILAFADENSLDDERWHTGHSVERESYAFLLERVLAESWLGLAIKPKAPSSLRRRLGPVAELLKRAEATGRCVVFEEGPLQGASPPAVAALAADLMIHGHLNAATAGLDAALAGVPTVLMDRLGWSISPLYRLGVGRVVFTEWASLWKACLEHWNRPGGIPGFGDWSDMLDELDPFRDGRAAERMGAYLGWLLEGFQGGLDRGTVMADAAERYSARWGKDKIAHVNCTTGMAETARRPMVDMGAAVGIAG